MDKYEELYKHAKSVFDEELSRFSRIEDKAGRFLTVITALLAVYALAGRQLFGDLLPPENKLELFIVVNAFLVLVSLLFSWAYAFRTLHLQGIKKAPLNNQILDFFRENQIVDIYYAMSEQYSKSLEYNQNINDLKASNIKKSFWFIVLTVILFFIFLIANGFNTSINSKTKNSNEIVTNFKHEIQPTVIKVYDCKENKQMSENDSNNTDSKPDKESSNSQPNPDVVAPEFNIVTESFDPTKLPSNKPSESK